MSTFEENIAILTRQQTAPADHARRSLAPQRAEALECKKALLTWIGANKASLEGSQQRCMAAAARGLLHTTMAAHLREVFGTEFGPGLLVTGPATCDNLVAQIDALSNFDVASGMPVRLAGGARNLRGLLGRLQELAADLARDDKELDAILANAAASATPHLQTGPADVPPAPRAKGVTVEKEFNPREMFSPLRKA